ncbi:hypothetical protein BDB00DRAFT_883041 [Zychaea mexicana]|uniref:uncharacterized protein n=1 Tax=Zychaea mexicana TaxID=64656 RepID=UPI0022FF1568|nr:uncharacterized protein BDB00DRAFT_883041 [Zychaea mexicana]KAI9493714.1 hypothetical protein BDB00DRAFT_883041 [Zychaea mexicana]
MVLAAILTDTPKSEPFKHGLEVKEFNPPQPQANESVVKVRAVAFNHRDIWILKGLYPGIVLNSVLGADAVGVLEKKGAASVNEGQRVLISPSVNWDSCPRGPEGDFRILGMLPSPGTFAETINIDSKEVFPCPEHLTDSEAAAIPLAGLTAYRALFSKCQAQKGDYVLVTGIGGGVALFALRFAVAVGAHVYVTSSNPDKIKFAKELGAEGGVNYKDPNAIEDLKKQLNGKLINAVVDGSGGKLFEKLPEAMAQGGIIAQYGDTASPQGVSFTRDLWGRNCELKGSTMGSRAEFAKMLEFIDKNKVRPVVSHSFKGLTQENLDKSVSLLAHGQQLGKVVIEI